MLKYSALLLTPGAGSNKNHSSLLTIENSLAPLIIERMDFSYKTEGRYFPDKAPKLIDEILKKVNYLVEEFGVDPAKLLLGGRSMGGRMCSMAVAEGLPAAGLILISYPLHPPKKPEKLRTEHFSKIKIPCLFLSGDRDPFGSPLEFRKNLSEIKGPVTTKWFPGARHDLANLDQEIATEIKNWIISPSKLSDL